MRVQAAWHRQRPGSLGGPHGADGGGVPGGEEGRPRQGSSGSPSIPSEFLASLVARATSPYHWYIGSSGSSHRLWDADRGTQLACSPIREPLEENWGFRKLAWAPDGPRFLSVLE